MRRLRMTMQMRRLRTVMIVTRDEMRSGCSSIGGQHQGDSRKLRNGRTVALEAHGSSGKQEPGTSGRRNRSQ